MEINLSEQLGHCSRTFEECSERMVLFRESSSGGGNIHKFLPCWGCKTWEMQVGFLSLECLGPGLQCPPDLAVFSAGSFLYYVYAPHYLCNYFPQEIEEGCEG